MTPWVAFLTGLTTGGLTCMAVQGGLLAGILAKRQSEESKPWTWSSALLPVASFLATKLIAYMVLGGLLGWLGSAMQLPLPVQLWFQALAAVFIIVAGLRIRWPGFLPWLAIPLPASARRFVRRGAKWDSVAAPAALGFLTILIPCGTTQAMEIGAIASRSAATGAAILAAFVLGTAPLFLLVGVLAKGTNLFQRRLAPIAAMVVIVVGLVSLNGVLNSIDSPWSFQNQVAVWTWALHGRPNQSGVATDNHPHILVRTDGYSPNDVTVPAGQVVTFDLATDHNSGCTSVFRIPKLGVTKNLPATGSTPLATKFDSPGRYTFTCGMGMYTGTITAI